MNAKTLGEIIGRIIKMIENIVYVLVFIVGVLSIILTLIYNIEGLYLKVKQFIRIIKESKVQVAAASTSLNRRHKSVVDSVIQVLHINSLRKAIYVLYILSGSFVFFMANNKISTSGIMSWISILAIVILFIGIGHFLHHSHNNFVPSFLSYLFKLMVVIIYPLVSFQTFINDINIVNLFLTVGLSLVYTVIFIKSLVDSFKSFAFQLINFLVLIITQNILYIGLSFGMYYLNYYNIYHYFTRDQYETVMSSEGFEQLYYVIYQGLTPFFSFPNNMKQESGFISYVPVVEHLIGYLFNLIIIGFFMSYSVSMLIERNKMKSLNSLHRSQ